MTSPRLLRPEGDLDQHPETPPWPAATSFDPHSPSEVGWSDAGKTRLWHGPGFLSLVADRHAPGLRWPEGARVALAVIVNLEHWDWEVPEGTPVAVSPLGGPEGLWTGNQPAFPDIGGYGNHEYGNRVGVFRVLAVLDKYAIKPTLALDKAVADHYPFLVREGQKRGAEFIAHGLSRRRIIHIGMSEDEERQYIHASIEAVLKATGTRPSAGPAPTSRRRRTPPTCWPPRASGMSATGATTSSPTG